MDFLNAKKRDLDKIEWCEINNIKIAVLPFDRKEEWKQLILQTTNQ